MHAKDLMSFAIYAWTMFWALAVITTVIVRYRIDKFDRLWVPNNGLLVTALVATLFGVLVVGLLG